MKKILALLFALLLLMPSLAFGDVIVEPDNSFYRTHQQECQLADGPLAHQQRSRKEHSEPKRPE